MNAKSSSAPFTPRIVDSRSAIADVLARRREDLGLRCLELDHRAGLQDGYSGKLLNPDRPQGRRGVHFAAPCMAAPGGDVTVSGMHDFLTETLGLRLVLMAAEDAEAAGAEPALPRPAPSPTAAAVIANHAARRGGVRIVSAGAHEVLDRVRVLQGAVDTALAGHPFIGAHTGLAERARAISDALSGLYDEIWRVD